MSANGFSETPAQRILAIQKLLPPAPGVKSRIGYASVDELARQVGTTRQRVIAWKHGAEPEERHRERLAELSQGRYTADDFLRDDGDGRFEKLEQLILANQERLDLVLSHLGVPLPPPAPARPASGVEPTEGPPEPP